MTIIGNHDVPLFKKDPNLKKIKDLEDDVDKLKTQLTFCSNSLSYAFKILDESGLNSPHHKKNMEILLQGGDVYTGGTIQ